MLTNILLSIVELLRYLKNSDSSSGLCSAEFLILFYISLEYQPLLDVELNDYYCSAQF